MKADELMIGDWVRAFGKKTQIVWVGNIHKMAVRGFPYEFMDGEIEPISLTPEILEKNGWKHEFDKKDYMVKYNLGEEGKNCWMMWAIKEHNLDIQLQDENLDVYNLKVSKVAIPCDYVHQLQHALKLCRIEKEIIL